MLKLKVFLHSESRKEYLLLKKLSLFCLMFVMMSLFAGATDYAEALGWWSNPQCTERGDGRTAVVASFTSQMNTDDSNYGMDNVIPLIGDLDPDNVTEIYVSDTTSNYLLAMYYSSGNLGIETQQSQGDDQTQGGAIFFDHKINRWSLAVPIATGVKMFTYNGSFFNNTVNITSSAPATPVLCSSQFSSVTYGNICWWMSVTGKFFEFHSVDHSVINKSIASACTVYGNIAFPSIASSINLNGGKVIVT
jgi:hypothetical protein